MDERTFNHLLCAALSCLLLPLTQIEQLTATSRTYLISLGIIARAKALRIACLISLNVTAELFLQSAG